MTSLKRKRLAFMSIANTVKGFLRKVSGVSDVDLEGCVDDASLVNYVIYGNSVQNGTPTAQLPVAVESTGEYDEEIEKYKIPVMCTGENGRAVTTNIYLDEPLRKAGIYADYIDFEKRVVVRQVGVRKLTDKDNYTVYHNAALSFYGFYMRVDDMKSGMRQHGFCTYIKNTRAEKSSIWFGVSNNILYISLPDIYNSAGTNPEKQQAVKNWIKNLKEPFLIYYPLAETEETPIVLPKLPTITGTCVFSAKTQVQPSNIELSYYSTSKE